MEKTEITVIGAGIVGLAAASRLSGKHKDIFLIERHDSFGRETSSRNSEVIHAGIYYPKDSLKRKTCVEGNSLLYEYCRTNNIPHRKTGKLIVAVNAQEIPDLEALYERGVKNGVPGLELISAEKIKKLEPYIFAEAAICSPSTGIVDTHSLMKDFERKFKSRGGTLAYNAEVIGIEKIKDGYKVTVKDADGGELVFHTCVLINCAGLDSGKIAVMAGLDRKEYQIKPCKGDYFRVSASKAKLVSRLVYPVPKKKGAGLGIHATPDLAGGMRLGPDEEYVERLDYKVDGSKRRDFYESVRTFLPFIEMDDLSPDTSGIRPKLQGPGEDFRDFVIQEESEKGFPGLIDLIGIESPGLTGCLSIAGIVEELI
jgi:L-2-hydroxyglutarate oxidase LhgO